MIFGGLEVVAQVLFQNEVTRKVVSYFQSKVVIWMIRVYFKIRSVTQ